MANLKVLDGDAAAKYLSTDGAGTDADPHVSHHVLDANTDGVYIGDIKFGESLLAGTNAIGKLAANSGVDIGDVTINNAAGAAAVNIQDGGNTITVDGTVAATQSGTWDVGTVTTITNPVAIKNAAADTVTGISGTYDTIDVSLTNGTYRATIDSSGYLTTNINGAITVDGSVTANTELPAAAALSDTLANPTTPMIGAALLGYDNTNSQWERLRTNDSGVLRIVGNGTAGSADAAVLTIQGVGSMTPVIVTGDSAGSLTVDQATAANLKATVYGAGSAGSADAGVVTIQGIASMTPILATLQASDGTDIGNVDVASVVPGTGASNLGKTEDAAHTSGDVGVMMLGVRSDDAVSLVTADGDYTPLITNEHGILRTQAQQHKHIDAMNATTGWTVLGNDTVNLATTTNHVMNDLALEFDKVDGAAGTIFAGIQKTLTTMDLDPYEKGNGFLLWSIYLSSLTNVAYVFLRLGTDSSNYNEWRVDDDELAAGWNPLRMGMFAPVTVVGDGWNSSAVAYAAVGVAFDDEANELADIAADHLSINTGLQVSADIVAEVSSSVRTPNVNILKVGNKSVDIGTGNAGVGTMRVVLASNQPVVSIDDNASSLSIDIGGQAPQLDDTDKIAVSLYGKGTNAGDDAVETDGSGNLQMVGTGTAGSAAGGILTVQGVGSMTPILATLQASDGTDIGNVDIASASFEKAEDAGHSNADKGVMALAVRHDTIGSLCGTDVDYTPLQVDATGYLYTRIYDGGSSITVDGSVTADTELPAAGTLGDAMTNPTTPLIGAALLGWDVTGTCWERLKTDESGILQVKAAANTGVDIGDVTINNAAGSAVYVREGTSASWNIRALTNADVVSVEQSTAASLNCTEASASNILTAVQLIDDPVAVLGTATYAEATTSAFVIGAVRNDTLTTLVNTDNEIAPLQVDASGALYVNLSGEGIDMDIEGVAAEDASAAGNPVLVGGRYDATPRTLDDTDVGAIALDADGAVHIADGGNTITVDGTVTAAQATHDNLKCNANIQQGDADVTSSNELYVRGSGTAGSADAAVLTVQGIGSMTPILATLQASDGTDIGNVDVATMPQVDAGAATPVVTPVTGNASPFSTSYAPSADFWLESIILHLSAAGTTSEPFTVTLNATDGGAYDTLLFSQDLSKGAVTDLVWVPEGGPMLFENGDALDVAWNNAETRTYGLRTTTRLA